MLFSVSLNILNLVQNFIITTGLLVGAMIVAARVVNGKSKPHEFVFFITYLAQVRSSHLAFNNDVNVTVRH